MTARSAPDTQPVSVLHLASGDLWAGAEVQIFFLLTELARQPDVRVQAVLLNDGELAARLRNNGVRVTVFDESLLSAPQLLMRLARLVRNEHVDVIHTHRAKENVLGGLLAALFGKRSLRTVHGAQEHLPGSKFSRRYISILLDRFAGRHLQQRVVAVSDHLCANLRKEFGKASVTCIRNGIDVGAVRAGVSSVPAADPAINVGLVGRLVQVKRPDVFLLIAKELITRHPGKFRFHIIGDGPLREQLEAQHGQLELRDACIFLGFRPDSLELIARLQALVMTSDHEGLPMVALEALALGVPVVAHAVGGLPEVVNSERQGRLVASQLPNDFADAIEAATACASVTTDSRLDESLNIRVTARMYKALYFDLRGS